MLILLWDRWSINELFLPLKKWFKMFVKKNTVQLSNPSSSVFCYNNFDGKYERSDDKY